MATVPLILTEDLSMGDESDTPQTQSTRAKETPMATTLAPLPETALLATLADDIPDPATPARVVTAAAEDTMDLSKLKDLCLFYVHEAMEHLTDDARLLLARLAAPPVYTEQATVTARSPEGFTVELRTAKATAGEMITAVGAMVGWCKSNGYTPV